MYVLFTFKGLHFHFRPKPAVKSCYWTYTIRDYCNLSIRLSDTALIRTVNRSFTLYVNWDLRDIMVVH